MQTLAQHYESINNSLQARYQRGELRFEEFNLVYSATERCSCGAGLARVNCNDVTLRFWHCSWMLLNGMDARKIQDLGLPHDPIKPFYQWDIKEEGPTPIEALTDVLSPIYRTTRPDAKVNLYTVGLTSGSFTTRRFTDEASVKEGLFAMAKEHGIVCLTVKETIYNATNKE